MVEGVAVHLLHPLERVEAAEPAAVLLSAVAPTARVGRALSEQLPGERPDRLAQRFHLARAEERQVGSQGLECCNGDFHVVLVDARRRIDHLAQGIIVDIIVVIRLGEQGALMCWTPGAR